MPSPSSHHQDDRIGQCAELFAAGARILDDMLQDPSELDVDFQKWAKAIRSIPEVHGELASHGTLAWLWEALRKAPALIDFFGNVPPAGQRSLKGQRHMVFPAGESFVIGMKGGEVARLLQDVHQAPHEERVSLKTKEPLCMRPGKGGRLECCDCRSEVTIRVDECFARSREADILRIDEEMVGTAEGLVIAQVNSLNQAYTVASRRLEPKRRSHGGRVYDHIVHVRDDSRMRLEHIRQLVESGCWETPEQHGGSPQASETRSLFDYGGTDNSPPNTEGTK